MKSFILVLNKINFLLCSNILIKNNCCPIKISVFLDLKTTSSLKLYSFLFKLHRNLITDNLIFNLSLCCADFVLILVYKTLKISNAAS